MESPIPDETEESAADESDEAVPSAASGALPIVGLGGSAGAIPALITFLEAVPRNSGLAYVIIMHLSPEHESTLAELLQRYTPMRVVQVRQAVDVAPDTVYVIPPAHSLRMEDGQLRLGDMPPDKRGRAAVDLFFRTLADTHGPRATAIVLSGLDSDGAIGIKRIKERGGLTIAQDPDEAQHSGMPRAAIGTGMVDWVLPVREMPARVARYVEQEGRLRLPPEKVLPEAQDPVPGRDDGDLREVLNFLRTRTGRDFSNYKRATILRRLGRRMLVNGVQDLTEYLNCLRTHPGEAGALLQDLLISVTNFFRDADCFDALEQQIPELFLGKGTGDSVRVWVAACATGEEAYSIAILLAEQARRMDSPPAIQIFATDLDDEAVRVARQGVYPPTIAADVSEERLRRFFVKEHRGYRVRRELREHVLFAAHDMLKDSPFSRLDLVTCRNLLIYLNRDAQRRIFETAHFALLPHGRLFLGASETVEEDSPVFHVIDKKHRIYAPRPVPRISLPVPSGPSSIARALDAQVDARTGPVVHGAAFSHGLAVEPRVARAIASPDGRSVSWGELHFKVLELLAPPSIIIDGEHEILHLSAHAGRFLQYGGGEPSRNLLHAVHPALRIELRAAIYQVAQSQSRIEVVPLPIDLGGQVVMVRMTITPMTDVTPGLMLVTLDVLRDESGLASANTSLVPADADPLSHLLDRELERLKSHLHDTVEQYEASTEELKASNEELQAMNEELRSATEELETSREELQSINEELTTVNHELKSKVDELGHANSDMQNLMDATAIATVFLDRELRITRYTPSAVTLFNLIQTDIGRPLSHLTNQLDYPELDDDARRVLQGLIPIEREVDDPRGASYLVRMLPYRTNDDRIAGLVLTLVDVTERKRSQEALRASEERLRLITDNATEYAIFTTDPQRRVTFWNPGAERLLGWTEGEIVGQLSDVIFVEEDRARDTPMREARIALEEGRASDERPHRRKNGERFWASGALMPMRAPGGQVVGFVKVLRDQTSARRIQLDLAASRSELVVALESNERARKQLEAADLAKDRFLAVLSHELRNPLASIAGATDALASGGNVKAADRVRAETILRHQIDAMRSLLDDLLDISRLRFGRLALRRQVVTIESMVDRAVETARPLIHRRRHDLRVTLPDGPVTLHVDPDRIAQVLANLLVNAAKYTPEGGRVELRVHVSDSRCVIDVVDNGRGLDEQTLQSMFEMFWRSGEVDPTGSHSMGIGLALARTIVQLHGGTVTATSDGPNRGSVFSVTLPLADGTQECDAVPGQADDELLGEAIDEKPCRIAIVDDVEDVAWTLATVLEAVGYEVRTASGGDAALALAEDFRPDIMVLDIALRGMNGLEVARRLRATPHGRRMLLVAATGWGSEKDREASVDAGFDAHLVKPIVLGELKRLMAHWRAPEG